MRRIGGFAAGTFLVLVLAVAPRAQAILNGVVETGYPAVGVVTDGGSAMASAVLVDPWWVMTSASFAVAVDHGTFIVGRDYAAPDATYDFAQIFPHPAYDPGTGANNIALILLATPVTGVAPLPWATAAGVPAAGSQVLYVGYGETSTLLTGNTVRRSCWCLVDFVTATQFATAFYDAGPYLGDSGAPALASIGGVIQVVGLVSLLPADGLGDTFATRVPAYATFVQMTMDANTPTSVMGPAPAAVRLDGVAPNPFNPRTEIAFTLGEPAVCRLAVYDLRGRLVVELADRPFPAGSHRVRWDGLDAAGGTVASGTYLVTLRAGDTVRTAKVALAR